LLFFFLYFFRPILPVADASELFRKP
jgi:hypothetical protein